MKWHRFVDKLPLKIFWIGFVFLIISSIPSIMISKAIDFFSQEQISTAVDLGKSEKMKYPNITVCFTNYFDKELLESKNSIFLKYFLK
jgi:hypothetical protein